MIYSLLVPTRERTERIPDLLNSLEVTVPNQRKQNIEILFAVDNDDLGSLPLLEGHLKKFSMFKTSIHLRDRSEFLNKDYYNWLASFGTGKYLWAIGDDVLFRINEWDKLIENQFETYLAGCKDRIACAGVKDSTPPPKRSLPDFPCFPLVTREAFEFFGFLLHPQIPTWGADYLLYLLYSGAHRYCQINDHIYLDHVSWHTKSITPDKTAKNIQAIFGRVQHIQEYNIDFNATNVIPSQIAKLDTYIRTGVKQ